MGVDVFLVPLSDPVVVDETMVDSSDSGVRCRLHVRRHIECYWEDKLLQDNLHDVVAPDEVNRGYLHVQESNPAASS